jgi:hypothetical protein
MQLLDETVYSYKKFIEDILPKIEEQHFVDIVESFVYRYHSNRYILEQKFTERYLNALIQLRIATIHRTKAWNKSQFKFDMWHLYIMAKWPQRSIMQLKKSQEGFFVWNTEWENAIKTHYNTHCYPGEY